MNAWNVSCQRTACFKLMERSDSSNEEPRTKNGFYKPPMSLMVAKKEW